MSDHGSSPTEYTNPFLWTAGLVGFALVLVWMFQSQMRQGYGDGMQHPVVKPIENVGEAVPDHMALINEWLVEKRSKAIDEGEAVYTANCVSCHGPNGQLAAGGARKFGNEALKNDAYGLPTSPLSLYNTLHQGYNGGAMPKQGHLSEVQKYQVIAYMRDRWLKQTDQYSALDDEYITELAAMAPAPREAGIDPDAGPHPATQPIGIPVYAVLSRVADSHSADASDAWFNAMRHRDFGDWADMKDPFLRLADTVIADDVRRAIEAGNAAEVAALVRRPSVAALVPSFGALSSSELKALVFRLARKQEDLH